MSCSTPLRVMGEHLYMDGADFTIDPDDGIDYWAMIQDIREREEYEQENVCLLDVEINPIN